jgi:hypothetical protein
MSRLSLRRGAVRRQLELPVTSSRFARSILACASECMPAEMN